MPAAGLYTPGLDIITTGVAVSVRAFDPGLVVVWNKRCITRADGAYQGRFEIYDRNAPGGPKWQFVMRVQNEDGSFRPLDGRVMDALYKARGQRVSDVLDEMDRSAATRDRAIEHLVSDSARGMAEDLKYVGRRITDSVESRNRTREAIRAVAS